ncbi:MarR family transcriptional regulator [Lentzea sp. NBRC 105346]|nr:MarR family transcriptional regulator [Lentzea sp. NBRC 105346]
MTRLDRQFIATGLREGLGYAEIARRLQRPTSTISREVNRNGGIYAYRADRAQQASAKRARRTATVEPIESPPGAEREFMDRFVELMINTGIPKTAARVLACVHMSDRGSMTTGELTRRLGVSPASISKAVAMLETTDLIQRTRDPRTRREHYVVGADVWYQAWLASTRMNFRWAEVGREGAALFGATPAGERLDLMARFFEHLSQTMYEVGESWWAAERTKSSRG